MMDMMWSTVLSCFLFRLSFFFVLLLLMLSLSLASHSPVSVVFFLFFFIHSWVSCSTSGSVLFSFILLVCLLTFVLSFVLLVLLVRPVLVFPSSHYPRSLVSVLLFFRPTHLHTSLYPTFFLLFLLSTEIKGSVQWWSIIPSFRPQVPLLDLEPGYPRTTGESHNKPWCTSCHTLTRCGEGGVLLDGSGVYWGRWGQVMSCEILLGWVGGEAEEVVSCRMELGCCGERRWRQVMSCKMVLRCVWGNAGMLCFVRCCCGECWQVTS